MVAGVKRIGSKVTDMFVDWAKKDADAQAEAVKRLGLGPNNTAADRATAMGFGDDVYHGTKADFDSFNSRGTASATYVTPSAKIANLFSNTATQSGGKKVLPLRTRGNVFDYDNPEHVAKLEQEIGPQIFGVRNGLWRDLEAKPVQEGIKKQGYDGFNVKETTNNPNKNTGIYNPANIRSKFAHFNPKYAGIGGAGAILSSNLMASDAEAAPVTKIDDMLKAWAKSDKEAQQEAVKRLGLGADNTAKDRAKAMGFGDETYYHGSADNIDEFRPNSFFADNGDSASSYAKEKGWQIVDGQNIQQGSNVTPIRTRVNSQASPGDVKKASQQTGAADGYDLDATESWEFTTPRMRDASKDPAYGVINQLENNGYDSAKHWDWDMDNREIDSLQIFDPANIRSPLAHFNPKMAGVGAGSVLSADLMADESNTKPTENIWSSLMNTIGNVNQQQAQAYGDTGANTMGGAASLASMLATDPAVAAEVIGTVGLKGIGAVSPYIKGFGLGLLLDAKEMGDGEIPNFEERLFAGEFSTKQDEDLINKLEGR